MAHAAFNFASLWYAGKSAALYDIAYTADTSPAQVGVALLVRAIQQHDVNCAADFLDFIRGKSVRHVLGDCVIMERGYVIRHLSIVLKCRRFACVSKRKKMTKTRK